MISSLDHLLRSVDPRAWQITYNIILDWYDGELEGWCQLSIPNCWFYYRVETFEPGYVERIFTIQSTPSDAIQLLLDVLERLESTDPPWWGGFLPTHGTPEAEKATRVYDTLRAASTEVVGYAQGHGLDTLTRYWGR